MSDNERDEAAAELDALEGAAAEAESEAGGGEYIPGAETEPEAEGPTSAEILAPAIKMTFQMVAARRGQHWGMADEEAETLAQAWGDVLDKYAPGAALGPELTAIAVTAAVVWPRWSADQAEQRQREAEAEGEGANDGAES